MQALAVHHSPSNGVPPRKPEPTTPNGTAHRYKVIQKTIAAGKSVPTAPNIAKKQNNTQGKAPKGKGASPKKTSASGKAEAAGAFRTAPELQSTAPARTPAYTQWHSPSSRESRRYGFRTGCENRGLVGSAEQRAEAAGFITERQQAAHGHDAAASRSARTVNRAYHRRRVPRKLWV